MHYELTLLEREAAHDLVNLQIYPRMQLSLGETETFDHGDATVTIERTGNRFAAGFEALTYRFTISGEGFKLTLFAVYRDRRCATAFVAIESVSPGPADMEGDFLSWLIMLTAKARAPRASIFDELLLDC